MSSSTLFSRRVDFYYLAFFLLSIGSLLATIPLGSNYGGTTYKYRIGDEQLIGPIEVDSYSKAFKLKAKRSVYRHGDWVSIKADILDDKKKYLFSVSDEFWHETGRDSEGAWSETHKKLSTKFSLQKGTYYLAVEAEYSKGLKKGVTVELKPILGATSLLYLTSIIAGAMIFVLAMFEKD